MLGGPRSIERAASMHESNLLPSVAHSMSVEAFPPTPTIGAVEATDAMDTYRQSEQRWAYELAVVFTSMSIMLLVVGSMLWAK
jgi:hypothetical protein